MTDMIDLKDLEPGDVADLYDLTEQLKEQPETYSDALQQKTLLMLFAKPSTRTRVSFETGMTQLGGHAIYFAQDTSQLSRGESLKDTAKVLSRYVDGIMARLFDHRDILGLAEHADVPVINGLTDLLHPCQALADLYTIREQFYNWQDVHIVYVGDGNNVAHSLLQAAALTGVDITLATPDGYTPEQRIIRRAEEQAEATGCTIGLVQDPAKAVETADVVYTDVWASMGDENEAEREEVFADYQVNEELLAHAERDNPRFMHPLPAHRGQEVTGAVMDSEHSIVYDQAENRLHVQKAVMATLMGD